MDEIKVWAITRVATDELIMTYRGTFWEVMNFLNRNYDDGDADAETYENWLNRQ
jgi:hypothetical protein